MTSLRARITLVTVGVAVLAVVVTGLISIQLVRSESTAQARSQLAAQADLIARHPALADRVSDALGDAMVATVSPDGTVAGDAASYVDAVLLRRLELGADLSTTRRGVIVEARQVADGSAIVLVLPRESVDALARASTWRIALALGIGALGAAAAAALVSRGLSRSLESTARSATRLAAGERGVSTPPTGPTEVAAIATALAVLDTALQSSEGRQREFLLSISHELRTPLTAIRGYAEALADGLVSAEAAGPTLVAETERLERFVGDLLELARLEADDFTVRLQPVVLPELLEAARLAWAARAAQLGVMVAVSEASTDVTASTDPQRVRQLIDGLVENALRVSPEGSRVTLSARTIGTEIALEVVDGGPGLAAADIAVAFDRGALHSRYEHSRPVGTGLGLSIAARLAKRLGGSISAGNADDGTGARFTVLLPRS